MEGRARGGRVLGDGGGGGNSLAVVGFKQIHTFRLQFSMVQRGSFRGESHDVHLKSVMGPLFALGIIWITFTEIYQVNNFAFILPK